MSLKIPFVDEAKKKLNAPGTGLLNISGDLYISRLITAYPYNQIEMKIESEDLNNSRIRLY